MTTDSIFHGETYAITVSFLDADDAPVTIDSAWTVVVGVSRNQSGPPLLPLLTMPISDGAASIAIDTGAWEPGTYFYQCRATDPDGNDYWSEPVRLVLRPRIPGPSA